MCVCVCACMRLCMNICMYASMYACMFCMYTCMETLIYIYIYTYTYVFMYMERVSLLFCVANDPLNLLLIIYTFKTIVYNNIMHFRTLLEMMENIF